MAGLALGASLTGGVTAWSAVPDDNAHGDAVPSKMSCPMMGAGMMSNAMMGMMGDKRTAQSGATRGGKGTGQSNATKGVMQNCQEMMGGGGMMSCPMMGGKDAATESAQATQEKARQRAAIAVTAQGYTPAVIKVQAGKPLELTFTRTSDATCATEVVVPDYKIKAALPLNKPVTVKFTPKKSGDIAFICGMGMFRGKVVAQ